MQQLAILGGQPRFEEDLHVGRPNIGKRERVHELIDSCLDRRWLTNDGILVKQLEQSICSITNTKHCVAATNATAALEILIRTLGNGGEVILPSFTFVATAHAVSQAGATPVFCDVDKTSHNIDPEQVELLISPSSVGILAVHAWGNPCETEGLQQIAEKHNLWLAYDSAHAFSCSRNGVPLGGNGNAEVFSFHATKFVSCAEGGAITTNCDHLANKLRLFRNFGFRGYDQVDIIGTNAKMSEIAAAIGIASIESMQYFIETNKRHHEAYKRRLSRIAGLTVMDYDLRHSPNYQYIVVDVQASSFGADRNQLVTALQAERVRARRYFFPGCHSFMPYRNARTGDLSNTLDLCNRLLLLPNGTGVTDEQVTQICDLFEELHHKTELWAKHDKCIT